MSRQAVYHVDHRFQITLPNLSLVREHCSPSGKFIWVTRAERLRVHTWKGVPGKFVDLLLPDVETDPIICEIGLKAGSFDGEKRWRLAFRSWSPKHLCGERRTPSISHPGRGEVRVEETRDGLVVLALWKGGGLWAQCFPQLRYKPEPGSRMGIILYHWEKYFDFLPEDDVRQTAEMWDALPAVQAADDIVVLNRMASSCLYDLATNLGWRKFTLRDKKRLDLSPDAPQWHRADGLILRSKDRSHTGCGQYTLEAASGKVMREVCRECGGLVSQCPCVPV